MNDLSVKVDRPVDRTTVTLLRAIDNVARELGLPYVVAGAMARDIVLTNVFGIETARATQDVDFAVAVRDWEQFKIIQDRLIATGQFSPSEKIVQRIHYRSQKNTATYPVDIIPFRGVEGPGHTVAWPPEMKVIMNVVGYEEVLGTAIRVMVEPELTVPIASLPGLALLKLFAWVDRCHETPKDAQDFVILLRAYHMAGNQVRIYEDEIALLEAVDYDLDLASPRLLGKDARRIASTAVVEQATVLLDDAAQTDRLVTHMAIGLKAAEDSIEEAKKLLDQFKIGFFG